MVTRTGTSTAAKRKRPKAAFAARRRLGPTLGTFGVGGGAGEAGDVAEAGGGVGPGRGDEKGIALLGAGGGVGAEVDCWTGVDGGCDDGEAEEGAAAGLACAAPSIATLQVAHVVHPDCVHSLHAAAPQVPHVAWPSPATTASPQNMQ